MSQKKQTNPSNRIEIGYGLGWFYILYKFSVETSDAGDDRCQNYKAYSEAQPYLMDSDVKLSL